MNKLVSSVSKLLNIKKTEIVLNLKKYRGEIVVIKYGGSAMLDPKLSSSFVSNIEVLVKSGIYPVIVHGGGPQINQVLSSMKIEHKFYKGMRVTDDLTFKIVEMVLSGSINKNISLDLSKKNINSIGISGYDSKLIQAKKYIMREGGKLIDLGNVGIPVSLNNKFLINLLKNNIVPVIAPIGFNKRGKKFNINADLTAGFIAHELKARRLLMLTDVQGVIDKNEKLISELRLSDVKKMISDGIIYGGMIPKVETCIGSVKKGVRASVIIDGRVKNALIKELFSNYGMGTLFRK